MPGSTLHVLHETSELARAVRTARGCFVDGHFAELARSRRRRCGLLEQLRNPPDDQGDDDEVDQHAEEVANAELETSDIPRCLLPVARWRNRAHNGHDEVIHYGLDDFSHGCAKHHRERQCDEVLLH